MSVKLLQTLACPFYTAVTVLKMRIPWSLSASNKGCLSWHHRMCFDLWQWHTCDFCELGITEVSILTASEHFIHGCHTKSSSFRRTWAVMLSVCHPRRLHDRIYGQMWLLGVHLSSNWCRTSCSAWAEPKGPLIKQIDVPKQWIHYLDWVCTVLVCDITFLGSNTVIPKIMSYERSQNLSL